MGGVPSCGAPNEAFVSLCILFLVERIAANYVHWFPKGLVMLFAGRASRCGRFGTRYTTKCTYRP